MLPQSLIRSNHNCLLALTSAAPAPPPLVACKLSSHLDGWSRLGQAGRREASEEATTTPNWFYWEKSNDAISGKVIMLGRQGFLLRPLVMLERRKDLFLKPSNF